MSTLTESRGEKPKVFTPPKRPSSLVMQREAAEAKKAAKKTKTTKE